MNKQEIPSYFSYIINHFGSKELPPKYPYLLADELIERNRRLRIFNGAQLLVPSKKSIHLYPIEGKDTSGILNFDLLTEEGIFPPTTIYVDLRTDDGLKLDISSPPYQIYEVKESNGICRINPNQIYFPAFPDRRSNVKPNTEEFKRRIGTLLSPLVQEIIWPEEEEISSFIEWYFITPEEFEEVNDFYLRRRRINNYFIYDVFPKEINLRDNPFSFPFFQVFFPQKEESFRTIRIDSGCQIGQIYDDKGCDCRWQFLNGLNSGATIIHLPFQDGRGFGMATKLATERLKHQGLDTVKAAKEFFGTDQFDIRNYELVAEFLFQLGIFETTIITDNKRKEEALTKRGITTSRSPTNSVDKCPHAKDHIIAKHNTDDYYPD